MLLLAWQCLAPSHWHVLFNNVGIFYCFAFITAREAKTENRNRKPDALKAELYRPTTVRCNMSIWIQKGGFLTGCLLNSVVFSPFPRSQNSLSYISQHCERLHLYLWPPIDHPGSRVRRIKGEKESKLEAAGVYFHGRDKKYSSDVGVIGKWKRVKRGNLFLLPCFWARIQPNILKKTTTFETSPLNIIVSIMDIVKSFSPAYCWKNGFAVLQVNCGSLISVE